MDRIFDYLDQYLMRPMSVIASKQFVRAVMAAGMSTIPFTVVGSAFLILNVLPQAFPVLENIWAASVQHYTDLFMVGNWFTMGVLALYFNIVTGYELTMIKSREMNLALSPINGALLGLMAFLFTMVQLSISSGVVVFVEGENIINGVSYGNFATRLGSSGIFTGIIMATLAVWIYKECVARSWTIKLPDAVPAGVSRSFTALIPCFLVAISVIVINGILLLFGYDVFTILSVPFSFVANIADTWYGVFIINLLITLLWSVGIHGASIIGAFYNPIVLSNLEENIGVLNGGSGRVHAFAGQFQNMFCTVGGSGATLGLTVWMCFLAKSEQLSILGKAAIGPALFNINEPLIFGIPIIYNPNLLIPFVLAQPVAAVIAYAGISSGLFPPVITQVPWPTPGMLGGFLGTASLSGAILALVCIVVPAIIYYPFAVMYDRRLCQQERAVAL